MIKITYDDYIWGDKFKTLSGCIFLKIDDAKKYLSNNHANKIVTHNGDIGIDETFIEYKDKFNIWFGQNVKINDNKFIPIPIGLENDYIPNAIAKKKMLYEFSTKTTKPKKLLYINHNIGTNVEERKIAYEIFSENEFITIHHSGGFDVQINYYNSILEHEFILSPPGNGIDCHRTWEILYLNRIPILKNTYSMKKLYEDLPVVFIDTYQDITFNFLMEQKKLLSGKQFNYNKLTFNYWKNLIESNNHNDF